MTPLPPNQQPPDDPAAAQRADLANRVARGEASATELEAFDQAQAAEARADQQAPPTAPTDGPGMTDTTTQPQ